MKDTIDISTWLPTSQLIAYDYDPTVVYDPELKLLRHSIKTNGWIQPILVSKDYEIIDGFHRWWATSHDKELAKLTDGKVPCAILDVTPSDRMMLTIRINRAKGNHVAIKMHEIIEKLYTDYELTIDQIKTGIGATKAEVELLLMQDVFDKKNIKEHKYSKAWEQEREK